MTAKHLLLSLLFGAVSLDSYTQELRKPELIKLPIVFSERGGERSPMENTPIVFNSQLLLVANFRPPNGSRYQEADSYLYIDDLVTGREVARFGALHSFVSAFVSGDELNIFALDFVETGKVWESNGITRFRTKDLATWETEKILLPDGDECLFNTSVCADETGYLMAYESNNPAQFCFKFARSNDLSTWDKIPGLVFGQGLEFSACPVIRYVAPYYYVMYVPTRIDRHNGYVTYMARSTDLKEWELSPFNPILEAEPVEGINNSDVDLLEFNGRTYLYYATGDQNTWSSVRVAMYNGPLNEFYQSHFPSGYHFEKISAVVD